MPAFPVPGRLAARRPSVMGTHSSALPLTAVLWWTTMSRPQPRDDPFFPWPSRLPDRTFRHITGRCRAAGGRPPRTPRSAGGASR